MAGLSRALFRSSARSWSLAANRPYRPRACGMICTWYAGSLCRSPLCSNSSLFCPYACCLSCPHACSRSAALSIYTSSIAPAGATIAMFLVIIKWTDYFFLKNLMLPRSPDVVHTQQLCSGIDGIKGCPCTAPISYSSAILRTDIHHPQRLPMEIYSHYNHILYILYILYILRILP